MMPVRTLRAALFAGTALAALPAYSAGPHVLSAEDAAIELSVLGQYRSGIYNQSAAEIVAFDPEMQRGFTVNASSGQVDILDLSDPSAPSLIGTIDVSDLGGAANSVSVSGGLLAVAVEADPITDPGFVAFYDTAGERLSVVEVGALPDAITFSPDGNWVLVANEGEPRDDYAVDPEGSISIIDVSNGAEGLTTDAVRTAHFRDWNGREDELRAEGVRIFGPGASTAQDFEPEWVEVASDNRTAYASLQENNAVAVIDIGTANVTAIHALPVKDWSEGGEWSGAGFDASRDSGGIEIRHWPVFGVLQPDTIRLYEVNGETYIVTANEGDARNYDEEGWWLEEFSIEDLRLDREAFPDAEALQAREALGRLNVTSTMGVANDCDPSLSTAEVQALGHEDVAAYVTSDCVYDALYAYGGRSMSIFRVNDDGLEWVYDTGSQMEETIAELLPDWFNADHRHREPEEQFKRRSPAKGPEPEGIALGEIDGRTYAFVGLERIGGIMVYDITEPAETRFVTYINNRDFTLPADPEAQATTDLGAEGLHFIPGEASPSGEPLLMIGNEVSGTTTLFAITATGGS